MLTSGPTQLSPSLTDEWTPHVNIIFLLPLHSGKGEREPGAPAVAAGEAFLATAVAFPTTACPPAAELAPATARERGGARQKRRGDGLPLRGASLEQGDRRQRLGGQRESPEGGLRRQWW